MNTSINFQIYNEAKVKTEPQMPPKHKKWNPNDMIKAINAVRNKQMGYLKASKAFGVPKGTVEGYAKSNKSPEELVGLSIGRKPVLSPELENELVQYALSMEERFFGLRARDVKRLAFQLAITYVQKVNCRTGKAAIITLTPYKDDLQESSEKRKKKPVPKRNLGSALEPKSSSKQQNLQKRSNKTQPNKDKIKSTESDINQPSSSGIKNLKIKSKRKRADSSSSSDSAESVEFNDSSSDESGGSDAECLFCMGRYSEDKHGEKWAKCNQCGRWAHEDCGEIKSDTFICSFCEGSGFFE